MSTNSPWGVTQFPSATSSMVDVMSEQLADKLNEEELCRLQNIPKQDLLDEAAILRLAAEGDESTADDEYLARMLQHEFDREHDEELKIKEKKINGNSKISLSFENYRSVPHHCRQQANEEDIQDILLDDEYEGEMKWDEKPVTFNSRGLSGKGSNMTTKHDSNVCGRKNATKMMEFPPEFEVGDGEGIDMRLSNHVYNKLKMHSMAESKRGQRLHDKKEKATAGQAVDPNTRLLLYKMVNNGVLDSINGSISTGKESVVFHAFGGEIKGDPLPKECAIKVFKTTLNEFKNRERYVHGDHRFSKDDFKKQNPRKIIKMWAMKETANLNRMKKFNLPCPTVHVQKTHLIVMSFIGENQVPAPKLKEAVLSPEDWEDAYAQTVQIMHNMHKKCHLVHADFSEFNLLWWKDQVWVIDVSQAVDFTHPQANEFLYRDCRNVSTFFRSKGVHDVLSPEALFNDVTGLNLTGEGADFLAQVHKYDSARTEKMILAKGLKKNQTFDFLFDTAQKERARALQEVGIHDSEEEEEEEEEEEGKGGDTEDVVREKESNLQTLETTEKIDNQHSALDPSS